MDWIIILSSHPREVRKIAKLQDSSRTFLFLFVIAASLASFGAIVFLLKSSKNLNLKFVLESRFAYVQWRLYLFESMKISSMELSSFIC